MNAVHFVGFRDDRYYNAVRVFGKPDFYHRVWDFRAKEEVQPCDVVVFAKGNENSRVAPYTFDDSSVM